jgi:hypothetical protein
MSKADTAMYKDKSATKKARELSQPARVACSRQ